MREDTKGGRGMSRKIGDTVIAVCKCGRKAIDLCDEDNYHNKYCTTCGLKFKLESPKLIGIVVAYEGVDTTYWTHWITIAELKKLIGG
jgi:hypothetical protein